MFTIKDLRLLMSLPDETPVEFSLVALSEETLQKRPRITEAVLCSGSPDLMCKSLVIELIDQ